MLRRKGLPPKESRRSFSGHAENIRLTVAFAESYELIADSCQILFIGGWAEYRMTDAANASCICRVFCPQIAVNGELQRRLTRAHMPAGRSDTSFAALSSLTYAGMPASSALRKARRSARRVFEFSQRINGSWQGRQGRWADAHHRLSKKSVIVKIDSQFNEFLLSGFYLQKWGIPNYIV